MSEDTDTPVAVEAVSDQVDDGEEVVAAEPSNDQPESSEPVGGDEEVAQSTEAQEVEEDGVDGTHIQEDSTEAVEEEEEAEVVEAAEEAEVVEETEQEETEETEEAVEEQQEEEEVQGQAVGDEEPQQQEEPQQEEEPQQQEEPQQEEEPQEEEEPQQEEEPQEEESEEEESEEEEQAELQYYGNDEDIDPNSIPIEVHFVGSADNEEGTSELMYISQIETANDFRCRLASIHSEHDPYQFTLFVDGQELEDDEILASLQSKYFNQQYQISGQVAFRIDVVIQVSRSLISRESGRESRRTEHEDGSTEYGMKVVLKGEVSEDGTFREPDKEIDVTVVREDSAHGKRFLGGYKNRQSGVEYHNADAQTAKVADDNKAGIEKFHRDAQTVESTNRSQQTNKDMATQMERRDLYLSGENDKVVEAGEYIPADDVLREREMQTINIQCFIRQCFAMRRVARLRAEREERREKEAIRKEEEAKATHEERLRDIGRRMNPRSKADFKILEEELQAWREFETNQIKTRKDISNQEKHALLEDLLAKEVKLLQTIDRLKIDAKKKNFKDDTEKILNIMASPKTWEHNVDDGSLEGRGTIDVDTPMVARARELVELYHGLCLKDLNRNERLDVIFNVKWVVKEYNTPLTNDILELIDREMDLLNRGRTTKSMEGLRKRLSNSFLKFVRSTEYNPEAAHFTTTIDLKSAKPLKWKREKKSTRQT